MGCTSVSKGKDGAEEAGCREREGMLVFRDCSAVEE